MIAYTVLISSADAKAFCDRLTQSIESMQKDGLLVEVQYQPVNTKDEYKYLVHTALLIGRMADIALKGGAE